MPFAGDIFLSKINLPHQRRDTLYMSPLPKDRPWNRRTKWVSGSLQPSVREPSHHSGLCQFPLSADTQALVPSSAQFKHPSRAEGSLLAPTATQVSFSWLFPYRQCGLKSSCIFWSILKYNTLFQRHSFDFGRIFLKAECKQISKATLTRYTKTIGQGTWF